MSAAKERVARYAGLRGALRALAPSTCFVERPLDLEAIFREVRGWLQDASGLEATGRDESELAALLGKIDSGLDTLAGEARARLAAIPLPQLRATLPERARSYPEEVAALLDLGLESEAPDPEWGSLLDYMITLLAAQVVEGRKRVAVDPVSVTPRVAARCEAALRSPPADAERLAATLRMAREELERGDPLQPILLRVRDIKRRGQETLFVPEVLRALVAYNVAAANRLEELDETDREIADLECREIASPGAAQPSAPDGGSAFDSPGLRAIADAVAARFASGRSEGGAAAQIAAGLDTGRLALFDSEALREPAAHPAAPVVRIAAALALLGRKLPDLGDPLARLGLDPEIVRTRWVAEVAERLSTTMQTLVRGNGFDDARKLADARNRLLSAFGSGATMPRAEDLPTVAGAPEARRAAPARPQATPAVAVARSRGRIARNAILAAAMIGAAIAAGLQWWPTTPGIERYPRERLRALSSHLEAGYADTRRTAADPTKPTVFVGRVGAEFAALPPESHGERGLEIARSLATSGIGEVMLVDATNRLLVHARNGKLAYPPVDEP